MKVCQYCGSNLKDDAVFCPFCGKKLESDDIDEAQEVIEDVSDNVIDALDEAMDEEPYEEATGYEPEEEPIEEAPIEEAPIEQSVKPARNVNLSAKSERKSKRKADNEPEAASESYEPFQRPLAMIKGAIDKCFALIGIKDADSIKGWQRGIALISVLAAILFIIAACTGAIYALAGIPAALTLGYFILKKPKFNAVCMVIPILLFALCFMSISAAYHGTMDSLAQLSNLSSRVSYASYNGSDYDKIVKWENRTERLYDTLTLRGLADSDDIIDMADADAVIFRIVLYAMCAVYLISLFGVIRKNIITSYIMLGTSCALSVYYLIKLLTVSGGALTLFYMAALLFMLIWTAFVLLSEKQTVNRKSRTLIKLIRVNARPAANYANPHPFDRLGGAVMASRIAAYVIAGIYASLSIYLIVLMLITCIGLGSGGVPGGYIFLYILVSLLQIVLLLGSGFISFVLGSKIARRDDSFLKHWHTLAIISLCAVFMLCSTPLIPNWALFVITIASAIILALPTLYFVKSKRVYVYMDTDKYLTQSSLVKKINPPKL